MLSPLKLLTLLLALTLAAVLQAPANAAKPSSDERARDIAKSWTADRRSHAKPREIVLGGKPRPGGGTTSTGASWPDSSNDPVERSVVKVFFELGGVDYVCSGSVVEPSGSSTKSVVLTAGHCVWDDKAKYATEFLVIPNYDAFSANTCTVNTNCWVADVNGLHASSGWRQLGGDDYVHDFAFASFNSGLASSVGADAVVPIQTGLTPPTSVYAFGYPAQGKYKGKDLTYCAGPTSWGPSPYDDNVKLGCDMTGGSSGGPWYADFNGSRVAVSLNSFGLRGYNGYMFGPVFDGQATTALAAAS